MQQSCVEFSDVFKQAIGKFKRIDIVVNNAGVVAEDNVRKTIMINLVSIDVCIMLFEYNRTVNEQKTSTTMMCD